MSRPLLADGQGGYLLINPAVCAPGVIEALLIPLYKYNQGKGRYEHELGIIVESFIRHEIENRGIVANSGDYKVDGVYGECDVVIETEQRVIFMEVKKKSLTALARGGSDFNILIDLANSSLAALMQSSQHENILRDTGSLTLVNNDIEYTVILNSRSVERFAVTFFDYGRLQHRIVLRQFMDACYRLDFSSVDREHKTKIEKLTSDLSVFRERVQTLLELDPMLKRAPFDHCWFISIPQLLIMLDDVNSNDEFDPLMDVLRHVTNGTMDYYTEYSMAAKYRDMINTVQKS